MEGRQVSVVEIRGGIKAPGGNLTIAKEQKGSSLLSCTDQRNAMENECE